ncbi:ribosome silencing factor [Kitasatospora sp. MAP5-34]|uniref:ribosome silencing factor n=1 Tax=Kitasatospora sp. MAP5-34 TaxID=3035102 RepID=UPI0024757EEF|nr:ribosome silencing factor [Kitasatospora sp. MAP5-34]MDH6574790.1 ribosome-associated protein [Kitasatospora sp. MAP5-34]
MTATDHSQELINVAAQAAADKLAHDIIAFDVSDVLAITDAFLIASAANDRQVKSIAEEIEEQLREKLDVKPVRREGEREGRWILLDFLDIVVHVQHSEERSFYSLDRLWKDCPELPIPADALATRNRPENAVLDADGNAVAVADHDEDVNHHVDTDAEDES